MVISSLQLVVKEVKLKKKDQREKQEENWRGKTNPQRI